MGTLPSWGGGLPLHPFFEDTEPCEDQSGEIVRVVPATLGGDLKIRWASLIRGKIAMVNTVIR